MIIQTLTKLVFISFEWVELVQQNNIMAWFRHSINVYIWSTNLVLYPDPKYGWNTLPLRSIHNVALISVFHPQLWYISQQQQQNALNQILIYNWLIIHILIQEWYNILYLNANDQAIANQNFIGSPFLLLVWAGCVITHRFLPSHNHNDVEWPAITWSQNHRGWVRVGRQSPLCSNLSWITIYGMGIYIYHRSMHFHPCICIEGGPSSWDARSSNLIIHAMPIIETILQPTVWSLSIHWHFSKSILSRTNRLDQKNSPTMRPVVNRTA